MDYHIIFVTSVIPGVIAAIARIVIEECRNRLHGCNWPFDELTS